jgi:hypothetical protein
MEIEAEDLTLRANLMPLRLTKDAVRTRDQRIDGHGVAHVQVRHACADSCYFTAEFVAED